MEKIVIRTDQVEPAAHLLSLLRRVFPECEIQIVSDPETSGCHDLAGWSRSRFQEEENG